MYVLNRNVGGGDVEVYSGEVPYPVHAEPDERLRDGVRLALWHRKHGDVYLIELNEGFKVVSVAHERAVDRLAHEVGRDVERAEQLNAAVLEAEVRDERVAEIAGADDDRSELFIHAERLSDPVAQLTDVIAVALLAEAAEAVEILADLACSKAHLSAELAGRNLFNAGGGKQVKLADIARKPSYYVGGNSVIHSFITV